MADAPTPATRPAGRPSREEGDPLPLPPAEAPTTAGAPPRSDPEGSGHAGRRRPRRSAGWCGAEEPRDAPEGHD